jgi:hypothetical protein
MKTGNQKIRVNTQKAGAAHILDYCKHEYMLLRYQPRMRLGPQRRWSLPTGSGKFRATLSGAIGYFMPSRGM